MQNVTLNYFNGRGRGEAIRLLLAAADVKFKDERISDWPAKKTGVVYGQLPMLEVDGVQIGQSGTIMRYIAECTNMGGKTPLDKAKLDATYETLIDAREALIVPFSEKDEARKPEKTKQALVKVNGYFAHLNKQLEKTGPFFAGDSMTYPDFALYEVTEWANMYEADILKSYPKLKAVFDGVAKQPNVAKYLKERPETKF